MYWRGTYAKQTSGAEAENKQLTVPTTAEMRLLQILWELERSHQSIDVGECSS